MSRNAGLPRTPPGEGRYVDYPELEALSEGDEDIPDRDENKNTIPATKEGEDDMEALLQQDAAVPPNPKNYAQQQYRVHGNDKTERVTPVNQNPRPVASSKTNLTPVAVGRLEKDTKRWETGMAEMRKLMLEMEERREKAWDRFQDGVTGKLEEFDRRLSSLEQEKSKRMRDELGGRREDDRYFGSAISTHTMLRNPPSPT